MSRSKLALFWLLLPVVIGGILFGSAGRWDVPMFWAYLVPWFLFGGHTVLTIDPDLARERMRPGGKGRDSLFLLRVLGLFLAFGQWIVDGLDVGRYHWSDSVPLGLQILGLVGFAAALAVIRWAQTANRFFSSAVRIQRDRGHHVVMAGPYAFVRHPGYVGFIFGWLGGALALGSWWGVLPSVLFALLFVRRTAMEDRYLQKELEGYGDYARTVRYRLVPGVW